MTQLRCMKCKKVVIDNERCNCANKYFIASGILLFTSGILISCGLFAVGLPLCFISLACIFLSFKYGSSTIRERTLIQESVAYSQPQQPQYIQPPKVVTPAPRYHEPTVHHVVSTHNVTVPIQKTVINNNYDQSKNVNISGGQIGNGVIIAAEYNDNRNNFGNNAYSQNVNNNQGDAVFAPNNQGNFITNQQQKSPQEQFRVVKPQQ